MAAGGAAAMVRVVEPGLLSGRLRAIPSKSHAHRVLIVSALAQEPTRVICPEVSDDILRTAQGLKALGARVRTLPDGFEVSAGPPPQRAEVHCGDSGATWRFLLPVAAALGVPTAFTLSGRLPQRPMEPMYKLFEQQGVTLTGQGTQRVTLRGKLTPGQWPVAGHVSSQFITGLMLAAPLTKEACTIRLTSPLASPSYVDITARAMAGFQVWASMAHQRITIPGGQSYQSPGQATVEGDWSNAALLLCGAAAGQAELTLEGLNPGSPQGDRGVTEILGRFGARLRWLEQGVATIPAPLRGFLVDLDPTPDLAPAVALLGLAAQGETVLHNIARLRLKESDRAASITQVLQALGGDVTLERDAIRIRGGALLPGGTVDSWGDHRIAMMAACAAPLCRGPVRIQGWQAVSKSYPRFFDDLARLGLASREED